MQSDCWKKCTLSLLMLMSLAALFSIVSAAPSDNSRIFFDRSTQGFPGFENTGPAGFSSFKSHLLDSGCRVDDTVSLQGNLGVLPGSTLSGYNAVFIVNPLRTLSSSEISQLTSFAEKGGSLVVICDSPDAIIPANLILQRFGLSFQREILLNTSIDDLPHGPWVQCAIPLRYGADDALEPIPRYQWVEPDRLAIPYAMNLSSIHTLNGTADRAYDLLAGTNRHGGEHLLMMAVPASEGKVVALGTKELLTNYRYAEGMHLAQVLMDLIKTEPEDDCDAWIKSGVTYSPDRLSIKFKEDKISLFPLSLTNTDEQPVSITISVPDMFRDVLQPMQSHLLLKPGEGATLYLQFRDREATYSHIIGEISLIASIDGSDAVYIVTIPFEAEHL